jgi:lipopolysaccharide heptosyltransferase I
MRILIIRLSALGDIVHTLPAVRLLKKHLPGCRITWAVERASAGLLRGYEGIDELLVSDRSEWIGLLRAGSFREAAARGRDFAAQLRSREYDLVLDFQGLFKSAVLAGLSRGSRKLGFAGARELAPLFYSELAPAPDFNEHAITRHMGLLRHLGLPDGPPEFSRLWGPEDERAVTELLAENGIGPDDRLAVVHPDSAWPTKRWPAASLAAAADGLRKRFSVRIVFVGAGPAREQAATIMAGMHGPSLDLTGRTGLRELAFLLSRASLVLSTDSGPLHLACAVGAPAVALFGPTAPGRTGPFGRRCTVVSKGLSCSPCFKRKACPLGHHRCMGALEVEEVLAACAAYLTTAPE